MTDGSSMRVDNPANLPAPNKISEVREPIIKANILVPQDYLGAVIKLCIEKRGVQKKMLYLGSAGVAAVRAAAGRGGARLLRPAEVGSRGYASFDYEFSRFQAAPLVQARHPDQRRQGRRAVDHRPPRQRLPARPRPGRQDAGADPAADVRGRHPGRHRQQIIARTTVKALRKNVLAKCYGGDISRKRKLLEKQKEGKKRMKQVGSVEIPQEAFLAVLQVGRK